MLNKKEGKSESSIASSTEFSAVQYAGFGIRLLAHNIDLLPVLLLAYLLSIFMNLDSNLDFVLFGMIYMLYCVICESSDWHGTIGKKLLKLEVKKDDFSTATPAIILTRTILKIPALLLFFVGFAMIHFDARRKGMHDHFAKTIVVRR